MDQNREYKAFLIRFQRHNSQHQWRTTLQDAQSKEVLHFATENEALRYLLEHLSEVSQAAPPK